MCEDNKSVTNNKCVIRPSRVSYESNHTNVGLGRKIDNRVHFLLTDHKCNQIRDRDVTLSCKSTSIILIIDAVAARRLHLTYLYERVVWQMLDVLVVVA